MQVGEEDFRHPGGRHLHAVVVDAGARAGVEDEAVAVAQLDEYAAALLVGADDVSPACSHERDPHLIWRHLLARVKPQVRTSNDVFETGCSILTGLFCFGCSQPGHRCRCEPCPGGGDAAFEKIAAIRTGVGHLSCVARILGFVFLVHDFLLCQLRSRKEFATPVDLLIDMAFIDSPLLAGGVPRHPRCNRARFVSLTSLWHRRRGIAFPLAAQDELRR